MLPLVPRPTPKNAAASMSTGCRQDIRCHTLIERNRLDVRQQCNHCRLCFFFSPALFSVTRRMQLLACKTLVADMQTHIGLFFHNPHYNLHPRNILLFCCFCEPCHSARRPLRSVKFFYVAESALSHICFILVFLRQARVF